MKRKINKIFKNKIVRLFILFFLGLFLTVWNVVTSDTSFSIWSYNHSKSDIKNINYNLFQKGETFKGEFKAQDNNLGIVSLRFQTYTRPPFEYEDHYLFRIKEKNTQKWYYENTYRSGLVYDVPFFPFGFPLINDSKGKTYDFELKPLSTNKVNQLSISKRSPIMQTKYKYSGKDLLKNSNLMGSFLKLKFINAFKIPEQVFSSFIYFLPFILYLIWVFLEKYIVSYRKRNSENKTKIDPFAILFELDNFLFYIMLLDIFVFQLAGSMVYLVFLLLWIFAFKSYGTEIKRSFIFAFILIAFCPILIFFQAQPAAEKTASWAFIILVASVIQLVKENSLQQEKKHE